MPGQGTSTARRLSEPGRGTGTVWQRRGSESATRADGPPREEPAHEPSRPSLMIIMIMTVTVTASESVPGTGRAASAALTRTRSAAGAPAGRPQARPAPGRHWHISAPYLIMMITGRARLGPIDSESESDRYRHGDRHGHGHRRSESLPCGMPARRGIIEPESAGDSGGP